MILGIDCQGEKLNIQNQFGHGSSINESWHVFNKSCFGGYAFTLAKERIQQISKTYDILEQHKSTMIILASLVQSKNVMLCP
jgi:hypothetical protein